MLEAAVLLANSEHARNSEHALLFSRVPTTCESGVKGLLKKLALQAMNKVCLRIISLSEEIYTTLQT